MTDREKLEQITYYVQAAYQILRTAPDNPTAVTILDSISEWLREEPGDLPTVSFSAETVQDNLTSDEETKRMILEQIIIDRE